MKSKVAFGCSLVLLFSAAFVFDSAAATATGSADLVSLQKKYSSNTNLKADFDLTTWWNVREREDKKSGSLLVAPGDKFRVTLGNDIYCSNGETYYHYNSASKQAEVKKLQDIDLSMHPSQMLTSFLKNYPLTEKSRSSQQVTYGWKSDSAAKSGYTSVEVSADVNGTIKIVKCTDTNGNIFTYTFTKTEFGGTLPKGAFEFEIPKDAQVVDER